MFVYLIREIPLETRASIVNCGLITVAIIQTTSEGRGANRRSLLSMIAGQGFLASPFYGYQIRQS